MYVSTASPTMYPFIGGFTSEGSPMNGRKIVIIDYDAIEGTHPTTGKIYKAITIELLQCSIGDKSTIEALAENKKIGYCLFELGHMKEIGLHPFVIKMLEEERIVEVLLKESGKIDGLLKDMFDAKALDKDAYQDLVIEAADYMFSPNFTAQTASVFRIGDRLLDGSFPFYIEGELVVGSTQDPVASLALNLCDMFSIINDSKKLNKVISNQGIILVKFKQGKCSKITVHTMKCPYAKDFDKIILTIDDTKVFLNEIPKIEPMTSKEYKKNVKQIKKNSSTETRCVLS